jgi:putative ABC transport system permease protein
LWYFFGGEKGMFKNYLKIAFRNIVRHRAYSIINIAGLGIGMASSILILLWVQNELSYDRFHANAGQIYRITAAASDFKAATCSVPIPAAMQAEMPQVKNTVRVSRFTKHLFEAGNRKFEEALVLYADSTFLQVFSFPLLRGDAKIALQKVNGVLITADMAKKYFGGADALGQTLKLDNRGLVTVTGVLANIPDNSHLQFDFILPMASAQQADANLRNNVWNNFSLYDYVQLDKNFVPTAAALAGLEQQIDRIFVRHVPRTVAKIDFHLQPLTAIHFQPELQVDLAKHGNVQYVHILFIVAIFILVVACINFMNLATARSARRAKEVGLRKVVGALRGQLIRQFLGESLLISFFALLLALVLVWMFLPAFNQLAQKRLTIDLLDGRLLLSLAGIAVATGLLAGSYPALYLSGFQPVKVLKSNLRSLGGNLLFRNGLVVTQFVVSIVLLVGTVVVYRQLQFIRNRNPGFAKANLLYMQVTGDMWPKLNALRAELSKNSLTANYALVSELPVNLQSGTINVQWAGKDPNAQVVVPSMEVSEHFTDVFQMKMLNGRSFSGGLLSDSSNFIINEKAAEVMGMTVANAVGKSLSLDNQKGMIIGVVKDFNFKPVQQAIEPLVLKLNVWGGIVVVRTKPGSTEATIRALSGISRQLNPAYPFNYDFLDQDLANLYRGEQQMGSIFNLFAVLAIFISCLGLYGLSAFLAQQRTREIGVRKVLGASVFGIIYLLSTGFTRLILVAVVIAVPVSYFAIHRWLESYAYHINVSWMIFALAALAALVIAWVTVSYESLKAAVVNPAKSLRSE